MATATPPPASSLARDHERIRSPLARLRKFIAGYISLEGATLVGLFFVLWFWIGMILDYGTFKLLLVDWVQWLPMWFRASVLITVVAALLALLVLTVLVRLLVSFTDAALALVLERRFPDKLGDRLITAVELADPKQVESIGYSPALVRETIHEAAARVDQVPVKEVFDWKRLWGRGAIILGLSLGLYLVVGLIFCLTKGISGDEEDVPVAARAGAKKSWYSSFFAPSGFADLGDVSQIWFERNILLRNTIWPRRSYLEIVDFPDDLRIAQNTAPPPLRVRAWKYVLADGKAREGWRLLRWEDIVNKPGLIGLSSVPAAPAEWKPRADYGITVDEVEQALSNFSVRTSLLDGTALPAKYSTPTSGEEGHRELMWSDLTADKLGGVAVPSLPAMWELKAGAQAAAGAAALLPGGGILGAAGQLIAPAKSTLSVDQVAQKLAEENRKYEGKQAPPLLSQLRAVFVRLDLLAQLQATVDAAEVAASNRANRRTLRKLVVPGEVTLTYKGRSETKTSSLTPIAGNEYTGNFSELKETVTFRVRGEDYETPPQTIVVVEKPRVEQIESTEEQPGYLYYHTTGDADAEVTPKLLRTQRQLLSPTRLQTSSDLTNFTVPTGTFVTLTVTISKPINPDKVKVVPDPQFEKLYVGRPVEVVEGNKLRLVLPGITREQRFTMQYHDEDDVPGERKFIVVPQEDTAPRIRELQPDEVVGKGKEGYVITALARVPFKGRITDDRGLGNIRYSCRVIPADFLTEKTARSLLLAGAVPLAAPGFGGPLKAIGYAGALLKELGSTDAPAADEGDTKDVSYIDLPAFQIAKRNHRPSQHLRPEEEKEAGPELLGLDSVKTLLGMRRPEKFRQLFKDFSLTADPWLQKFAEVDDDEPFVGRWIKASDIRREGAREPKAPLLGDLLFSSLRFKDRDGRVKPIKAPDDQPQRRFVIEVNLVVDDTYYQVYEENNLPRGELPRHRTLSETFTFVVVPENELRSRIAQEEDQRYRDLVKTIKPITDAVDRAREMNLYLSSGVSAAERNNFRARTVDMIDGLQGAHQEAKVVYQGYERILRELRLNQVAEKELKRVYESIYKPLQDATVKQFDQALNEVKALKTILDDETRPATAAQGKAKDARDRLMDLQKTINNILAAMEGLSKLNELVAELARIEREVETQEAIARALYREARDGQFKDDPKEKNGKGKD